MRAARIFERGVAKILRLTLGVIALSSCDRRSAPPELLDLTGAALDTVWQVSDDRSAILAASGRGDAVAILADTNPFVELTGPDAKAVKFGTSGDGPGELKFPSGVAWSGDSVAVWDPSLGRLTLYGRDGGRGRVVSAPHASGKIAGRMLRDGYGDAGRIAATSDGIVIASYAGVIRQPMELWPIALVRIHPDGRLDTIPVRFPPVDQLRALNHGAQELVAVPLWASCGAPGLVTWDPVGRMLRRYSAGITPTRSDSIAGTLAPLTEDLIKLNLRYQLDALLRGQRPEPAVYEQMIASMLVQSRDRGDGRRMFPDQAPSFVSMQCEGSGTVWLEQFSLSDAGSGMGRTWTVVDTTGMIHMVRLPLGLRVLQIMDGAVWGEERGNDGQLSLVKMSI